LGVEPYPAFGYKITELDQQWHKQFLGERDKKHVAEVVVDEPTVGTQLAGAGHQAVLERMVEADCIAWIGEQLVEAGDLVGHMGVGVGFLVDLRDQAAGIESLVALQKSQQINDLMITPVTDVAP